MSFGLTTAEIAGVGLAITAAGAAAGTYGAMQSAAAQKAASAYQSQVAANNATIASMSANAAIETGNTQLQAAQEQAAQQQGMIRAVMGAGGIDLNSGSSLRDQEGVAEVNQLNEATITSNAARAAWNYTNQGQNYAAESQLETQKGEEAESAGLVSGFSSLLSGAGTFAKSYSSDIQTGLFSS